MKIISVFGDMFRSNQLNFKSISAPTISMKQQFLTKMIKSINSYVGQS